MKQVYIVEQIFDKVNFIETPLEKGEYEACSFNFCDFSNANLSDFIFTNCDFSHCNLSLAKLTKTSFHTVVFKDCKMLGMRFENCEPFGLSFSFDNCLLNHASFYKTSIRSTVFKNCQMQEIDFSTCDLTAAIFENCDLARTTFENTNLEKSDLRTAFNYSIDPEVNKIKKAKFSLFGIAGLLEKYSIEIEE
jgi:fluoroquinolone resistance protein